MMQLRVSFGPRFDLFQDPSEEPELLLLAETLTDLARKELVANDHIVGAGEGEGEDESEDEG